MNQTFSVTLDAPEGYEFTGEYRTFNIGESHLNEVGQISIRIASGFSDNKAFILRRAWAPPAWMPIENWLYHNGAEWRIANQEPRLQSNNYYQAVAGSRAVKVLDLAVIMGQTFVPPP